MVYIFFDKKKTESQANVNEQLAKELNKLVVKKFQRCICKIWGQYFGSRFSWNGIFDFKE